MLFTADHGTNVGERGRFGKGFPVREQEAHTPLMLRVPGDRGGRSDAIVQPQDIYATVMGLAGLPVSEGLDSHDVLGLARQGKRGPRSLALSSNSADNWTGAAVGNRDPRPSGTGRLNSGVKTIFNVFNRKWGLEFAPNPEYCRLSRLGAVQDVAAENPSVVEEMHAAAIEEVQRMGMDPKLVEWVRSEGETEFPSDCKLWDGYPGPAGYFRPHSYSRLYFRVPVGREFDHHVGVIEDSAITGARHARPVHRNCYEYGPMSRATKSPLQSLGPLARERPHQPLPLAGEVPPTSSPSQGGRPHQPLPLAGGD